MTIPMPALNSRQRCAINRSGLMAPFLSYVQALRMEKLFAGLTESAAASAGEAEDGPYLVLLLIRGCGASCFSQVSWLSQHIYRDRV